MVVGICTMLLLVIGEIEYLSKRFAYHAYVMDLDCSPGLGGSVR